MHASTGRPAGSWEVAEAAVDLALVAEASEELVRQVDLRGDWQPAPSLVRAVQRELEERCDCKLMLESASATLYTAGTPPTALKEQRHFDRSGRLVAASAMLQGYGHTVGEGLSPGGPEERIRWRGCDGGGHWLRDLEAADRRSITSARTPPDESRVLVASEPGDLLLLFGAWCQPREVQSGTSVVLTFLFHEAVLKMAMEGADAVAQARAAAASRRQRLPPPPVLAAEPEQEEQDEPVDMVHRRQFVDDGPESQPEPEPEPEPELEEPPSVIAAAVLDSMLKEAVESMQPADADAVPPPPLASEPQPEPEPEPEPSRFATSQQRLAARLEGRRAAAEERRRIAHASEWLESEPAKLPSLIQDAWEWAQPAATSPGAAREETAGQGLR